MYCYHSLKEIKDQEKHIDQLRYNLIIIPLNIEYWIFSARSAVKAKGQPLKTAQARLAMRSKLIFWNISQIFVNIQGRSCPPRRLVWICLTSCCWRRWVDSQTNMKTSSTCCFLSIRLDRLRKVSRHWQQHWLRWKMFSNQNIFTSICPPPAGADHPQWPAEREAVSGAWYLHQD